MRQWASTRTPGPPCAALSMSQDYDGSYDNGVRWFEDNRDNLPRSVGGFAALEGEDLDGNKACAGCGVEYTKVRRAPVCLRCERAGVVA